MSNTKYKSIKSKWAQVFNMCTASFTEERIEQQNLRKNYSDEM